MSRANRKSLVLDDDEFVRGLLTRQLNALGITEVEPAADGQAALTAIRRKGPFGLVICDLLMPGMDGIEFLRHLAEAGPGTAVIIVSAQEPKVLRTAEALARARGLRLLGALKKPVSTQQLGVLLERWSDEAVVTARRDHAVISPAELNAAIQSSAIDVHVQPKVHTADRSLEGVEALARWQLPDGRGIPPDRFIPLAEEAGLIDELTYQVLRRSLESCSNWLKHGLSTRVSVNISPTSLANTDLPALISGLAGGYGVPLDLLTLEITESRVPEDEVRLLDTLTRLKLHGIRLSIDDFGTGYSSLRQLQRLPFSELKIDGGFIRGMLDDVDSSRIVESSVKLARDLGLVSVAECVESEAQFERLRELGCDLVQGYLIARPLPRHEFLDWCRRSGSFP